jgi:hypothetical protein
MTYDIFCLTLFCASAIIPIVALIALVVIGVTYLTNRRKVRGEIETDT